MAELLFLRLEGILQSWGERARWDTRDTASVPTKSGVVGLIACAMGIPRGDERIMQLENKLRMGVRVDNPGLWIEDYHTITGHIRNAEGKVKKEEETKITPRRYLQDASFLVVFEGSRDIIEECRRSLKSPVWQLFLGRKSCVPTVPIYEEDDNSKKFGCIEDAISELDMSEKAKLLNNSRDHLIGEIEIDTSGVPQNNKLTFQKEHIRRDVTKGNPARNYSTRAVWLFSVPIPVGGESNVPIKN